MLSFDVKYMYCENTFHITCMVFIFYNHQQNKVLLVVFERQLDNIATSTISYVEVLTDLGVTCEFTGCVLPENCWAFIKDTATCQNGE